MAHLWDASRKEQGGAQEEEGEKREEKGTFPGSKCIGHTGLAQASPLSDCSGWTQNHPELGLDPPGGPGQRVVLVCCLGVTMSATGEHRCVPYLILSPCNTNDPPLPASQMAFVAKI